MLRTIMRLRPFLPPPVWRAARDAYWSRFWASELKDQQRKLGDAAAASLVGSERAVLAEAIGDAYPFDSLLEVGCSYGQLFHTIAAQYPGVPMVGVDPNSERISAGIPLLGEAGIKNVTLTRGSAESLGEFADKSFDLVVTSASLLYLPPERIEKAIAELIRVSRKQVLLLEQHVEDAGAGGKMGPQRPGEASYWLRNYRDLFLSFLNAEQVRVERVPRPLWRTESWQVAAHLISATLS